MKSVQQMPPRPPLWRRITAEQLIAAAAIVGVGISLYQINEVKKSQKDAEAQQEKFRSELNV